MKRRISASQLVVFIIIVVALFSATAYAISIIWRQIGRERNIQQYRREHLNASVDPPPPNPPDTSGLPGTPNIPGTAYGQNGSNNNDPVSTGPGNADPGNNGTEPSPDPLPVIPIRNAPAYDMTMYDAVILNARLINPETYHDMAGYNIGVLNGRIAAITRRPLQGRQVIDATGLIAAPGFIDILSFQITEMGARFKIADGVTTNMQMHGGAIIARNDLGNKINNPPIINFGMSNFVSSIRSRMGYGTHTVMRSEASINQLVGYVRQNILDGSVGISLIPEYTPGVQGAEILALAHLAAEMGVPMHWHIRYATPHGEHNSLVAIQEVIDFARETGASMHINHINSTGATHVAGEAFAMIHAARAEGLVITACVYPYDYWASNISSARFAANWQTRFGITYHDLQIPNTTTRLTPETFRNLRLQGQIVFALGTMPEEEIRLAMQQDFMMIGSDTMTNASLQTHPRGAGTFSRVIGYYAREEGVITLMEALTMMTIRSARHLEQASYDAMRKGRLQIGADADITLFCWYTIIDTATPENVASYSDGIYYVFVNGRLGLDRTGVLNVRAGQPLRSRFISPKEAVEYREVQIMLTTPGGWGINEVQFGIPYILPVFPLFGYDFIDLRAVADTFGIPLALYENGDIRFGQAHLQMGETAFESYGQHSHLHHEPVIFRGSVFVPLHDLPPLAHQISYEL